MRKSKITLLLPSLLFLIFPDLLTSQVDPEIESKGDAFFEKGEQFYPGNLDSTFYYCELALSYYKEAESWEKYVFSRNVLNTIHYTQGDYLQFQVKCKETLEEAELHLPEISSKRSGALSNYAIYFREIGDFKKSAVYLNEALDIENRLKENADLLVTLGNLGTVSMRMGDFGEALKYYAQVHALSEANPGLLKLVNKSNNFIKLGSVFYEMEMLDTAKMFFNKSLDILSKVNVNSNKVAQINLIKSHLCLAETHLKQNNSNRIQFHVSKALELSIRYSYEDGGKANEILGRYARRKRDFSTALDEFLKSKSKTIEKYKAYQKHYLIAEKDILLAEAYVSNGQCQASLDSYQDALQMLSQDELSDDVFENPSIQNIYSRINFLNGLFGKAYALYEIYLLDKDEQKIKTALSTLELASQLILEIRQDYNQENSRLQLSVKAMAVYELAIGLAIELNAVTGEKEYLEAAFRFSESNKAVLLLESINENTAKGLSGIPDDLLEKENDLRYGLLFYKRKLNEEKNKKQNASENIINNFSKKIFELDQAYQGLIKTFEKDYPKYHQLKYDTRIATLSEIQSVVHDNSSVLIEFFVGVKNIYVFSITGGNISAQKIDKNTTLLSDIKHIRNLISQPPIRDIQQNYNKYVTSASRVFQEVLKRAIPTGKKQLIIIPDDRLGYLPFEILLKDKPATDQVSYSIDNLSYLLETYEISYAYSATLLIQQINQRQELTSNKFIGFAPSFNEEESTQDFCNGRKLYDLSCNQNEVEQIIEILGGEKVLQEEATKKSFEQYSSDFQIIHLATHACVDDDNPAFSKIYFADDYISSNDLYGLGFNSELVVLSACETGGGRLAKGEGVMSLARGFFNAGCPSVIMSLWSVDDCATAQLMASFYQSLAQGDFKSGALRQAKLSYLNSAKKAQQHPYYWAGFVQIGNHKPLTGFYSSTNLLYGAILLVIVLALFFYFFKK